MKRCVLSIGLVLFLFDWVSSTNIPPSMDTFINGGNVTLPSISTENIANKQQRWSEHFKKFENRKIQAYLGIVLVGIACATCFWYVDSEGSVAVHPEAQKEFENINASYAHIRIQELNDYYGWRKRSWSGKIAWFSDNVFEVTVTSILLAVAGFLTKFSWSKITHLYDSFIGPDTKDSIQDSIKTYLEDADRLAYSLRALAQTVEQLDAADTLHNKVRLHMVRSVVIDHYAFITATEDLIALAYCLIMDDVITNEQRYVFQGGMNQLIELMNDITEREEKLLTGIFLNNNAGAVTSLLSVFGGSCQELCRVLCTIGSCIYGKDFVCSYPVA